MKIRDKVFVVTGGASGLGLATAKALLDLGARIVLTDINSGLGERICSDLGPRARFAETDVTCAEQASAAVAVAQTEFSGIHGLINCAGIAPSEKTFGRHGPHQLETFVRAINVNLIGTFNMIRIAAAAMAEMPLDESGERGVIVNTSSIAAFDGQIGQVAYAASKAGVAGMTLPLARDLGRHAIRVVTIAPGVFETPMLATIPPEVSGELGAAVPFPSRLGRPEEFAALVIHICENSMLNGEIVRLDGALRMGPK